MFDATGFGDGRNIKLAIVLGLIHEATGPTVVVKWAKQGGERVRRSL